MSASEAIFMAKTIKKYKNNKYNKNQQTNKQVILHKMFYITYDKSSKTFSGKIILNSLSEFTS